MLKMSLVEFFLRAIPEGFLFIFAVYVFSKTTVNKSRYILSSIIFIFVPYLIRLLPIDYGIHTLIGLIFQILLAVYINKINVLKSIQACILSIVTMFVCEGINVGIIKFILKKDLNTVFSNSLSKMLYGIPSLLIFACIVCIYYFKTAKRK